MSYKTESVKAMKRAHSQPVASWCGVWGAGGGIYLPPGWFLLSPCVCPLTPRLGVLSGGIHRGLRRRRLCCVTTSSGQPTGQQLPQVGHKGRESHRALRAQL